MQERNLRVLEFGKIRDMLAAHAVTDPGRAACLALEPSGDFETVRALQAQTEEADTVLAYSGGNPMAYFKDVREYLKLASVGATLSAKALLDVAEALKASRVVRAALVTDRENTPLLTEMGSRLSTNRSLEEEIFSAILSEDEISDHASQDLYDIRRHIRQINDRVRDKLNSLIRSSSMQKYLQDAIITMRNDRYVVPVKAECRQFVPGLVHDQSGSGSTLFIEPMAVVEAGNELKQWSAKEKQEIQRILSDFSARVAPDAGLIARNLELLSNIDCIFAKAMLGREMKAVPPKINREGRVNLRRARHPLIDPEKVVPSNLWLGGEFTTLIITGPNTGGKTVTLKTVGLLSLMTQAGLLIPADFGSEMAVFDEVFADIGDEQSIEQSLSTFSSHMTNIVKILSSVTEHSLALFDELGAGTDPTEGAALAMSILDHLLKQHVTTMATTHYSELKVFALTTPGVENASVEFNVETLRPTYRLSIGVPGKSNAFEISRKLGLPDFLIEDAGRRLTKDQVRFEDVIANAEYHRQVAEKERKLAEEAHIETTRLRDEAEKLQKDLASRREEELRKAKADARKVLLKAQREAESIISDLKKTRAAANVKEHELHEVRARLQSDIDDTSEKISTAETGKPLDKVNVGDTVELTNLGVKAEILTLPDAKGECTVQAGALKLKANLKNMRSAQPDKPKKNPVKKSAASVASGISARAVERECDVRGMNLEEAICAVDLFLDGAIMNKLNEVYIIHGKGTGILRAGIQKHLRSHPAVKEFRLGRYGEGEDGVTVVTLK
ncbi:MAG: endonuclease MutS2 [Eubacteriales bacterium]|nr:endonuclease MutS2 [Clostridiales bacterium]MDY2602081.1 endonuclease MutS2 [Eubacteriales bacterium]